MNQETKDAWIWALESGEYVQGFGAYVQEIDGITHHCALGVLHTVEAPQVVKIIWAGEAIELLLAPGGSWVAGKVMLLNDAQRLNFKEIAEWIRENVTCDS